MKISGLILALLACPVFAQLPPPGAPGASRDPRYCGEPARTADGKIRRSPSVLADFQRMHPCPSTGLTIGSCPGWGRDHVLPLALGYCDVTWNLQWLPLVIKSCPGTTCKDRFERLIYANPQTQVRP